MTQLNIHKANSGFAVTPELFDLEIVERKFRGHPDSLADLVAQRFSQLYIHEAWKMFPELKNKGFPNFSADKIVLSGASTKWDKKTYEVLKPVHALLIGKITSQIGGNSLPVEAIFENAINQIFTHCLGHRDFLPHIVRDLYVATLAGTDHNASFYNPNSTSELLKILSQETHANDTVYVVAYSPLSLTEKLTIKLDNITASKGFQIKFPQIGKVYPIVKTVNERF